MVERLETTGSGKKQYCNPEKCEFFIIFHLTLQKMAIVNEE